MSRFDFTESTVEAAALAWLEELGYAVLHGPDIEPEGVRAERVSFGEVLLVERLRAALARINPSIPADAREEAVHKLTRVERRGGPRHVASLIRAGTSVHRSGSNPLRERQPHCARPSRFSG